MSDLRRVQRRRWWPTVILQGMQRQLHRRIRSVLARDLGPPSATCTGLAPTAAAR